LNYAFGRKPPDEPCIDGDVSNFQDYRNSARAHRRCDRMRRAMSAFGGKADIAAHCSCTMNSRLRRPAGKQIVHPPHFGPRLRAIRNDDLMPPLGWENRVWRPGNARGAWGGASRLMAERPGFGGWGDRSTCLYVTAAPITRNSALGDYPLSLGIGPPRVASAQAARYQTQNNGRLQKTR
jgi:hypothetical protein